MLSIEKVNNFLYSSKSKVLSASKWITFASSILAFILVFYENGFFVPDSHVRHIREIFDAVLIIFVIYYLVQLVYSFQRVNFLKETWIQAVLMVFITVISVSKLMFDHSLTKDVFEIVDSEHANDLYRFALTAVMVYLAGFELVKVTKYLNYLGIKPAATFMLSFLILIGLGTALLMLPRMTVSEGGATFLQALFTSVSASCVTGLAVVDTGSFFTLKGQIVILMLFQMGGIGIVSFATFFATFLKKGVGLKHQVIIQNFLNSESLSSSKTLLRQVIIITLLIELIASVSIYFTWGDKVVFHGVAQKVFYSIFHGVSAFCNAGFSLFPNSFYQEVLQKSYLLHIVLAITIIVGSLGFSTVQDILSPKNLRDRLNNPWKEWAVGTKISVYTALILIAVGTLVFFLLEKGNVHTLKGVSYFEQIIGAFFQSVTARTAGFNTIDIGSMMIPSLIFMIFLMFIGASSGSTGGGIKTSTFLIIVVSAIGTIKGKKNIELGRRTISTDLINKAFSVFVFAATYNLIMIFLLTITESHLPILSIVFEQISAFATVGLTTGVTTDLSVGGKLIIITSMFIGRIGTLTLALALSNRSKCNTYEYPKAHIMVG
ncbi:MAG: TrkH family potassium uptake protein [Cyclobacteriaceae bacterium]